MTTSTISNINDSFHVHNLKADKYSFLKEFVIILNIFEMQVKHLLSSHVTGIISAVKFLFFKGS